VVDETTPRFEIPESPRRRYPRRGGVEYEGGTMFVLEPGEAVETPVLVDVVESTLEADAYRYGDWFDLPMPVYLVHDDVTGDTFRVAIRDGTVQLHVLPATESTGLRRLFDRLRAATDFMWTVTDKTDQKRE